MANKTWGLGFYKYNGTTYAPYKAWLPKNMVGENVQLGLSTDSHAIRFVFADGTTPVGLPLYSVERKANPVYNLSGQRIDKPVQQGVYVVKGKGKYLNK